MYQKLKYESEKDHTYHTAVYGGFISFTASIIVAMFTVSSSLAMIYGGHILNVNSQDLTLNDKKSLVSDFLNVLGEVIPIIYKKIIIIATVFFILMMGISLVIQRKVNKRRKEIFVYYELVKEILEEIDCEKDTHN
jgi:hypothetical protein